MPAQHRYQAFGLAIQSGFELPFAALPGERSIDVDIREGSVPASLRAPVVDHGIWQAEPHAFLLHAAGVARFLVRCGREIVVAPRGGSAAAIAAVLNASVAAALLQQRGVATVYASAAVRPGGGAVLLFGFGKSALLAALLARGYRLLADDFTAVAEHRGKPCALPAYPALRLWADMVAKLGWETRARSRVNDQVEKYLVPVPGDFHAEPATVTGCLLLANAAHGETVITPIPKSEALRALGANVYRKLFAVGEAARTASFRGMTTLAKQPPMWRVARAVYGPGPAATAQAVDRHLQAAWPAGSA